MYPYEYLEEVVDVDIVIIHVGTLVECMDFIPKTSLMLTDNNKVLNLSNLKFIEAQDEDWIIVNYIDMNQLIFSVYKYRDYIKQRSLL